MFTLYKNYGIIIIYCYSMKLYSKRKAAKIKEVLSDNDNNPS